MIFHKRPMLSKNTCALKRFGFGFGAF